MNKIQTFVQLLREAPQFTALALPDSGALRTRLQLASTMSRSCLYYVFDFTTNSYLEAGPGKETFMGYTTDYLKAAGPFFWMEQSDSNDLKVMNEKVIPGDLAALKGKSQSELENIICSTNYRVKTRGGDKLMLLQRTNYLCDTNGRFLAAMGTVDDISHFKQDSKMTCIVERFSQFSDGNINREILRKEHFFPNEKDSLLSPREIEILKWICDGLSSKQIADHLFISLNTVNNHRKRILEKTNARNMAESIQYAVRNGIL
ncbi:MAG: helix-turn-helix transcriptional regulator [Bacteroidetes bacterium]|nr:helix-turn-helix transcriptional regulator [Bacteroidota bacterium]